MMTDSTESRIKAIVEQRLGMRWADFHDALMPELTAKLRRRGIGAPTSHYGDISMDEVRELAPDVTVGETYFFRDVAQLEALAAVVVPDLVRIHGDRPVRILSAGCSSGEEAYSIVIALQEHGRALSTQISVTGIDVNPAAIMKARRARYSPWALRATPQSIRDRYFRQEGKEYCLRDDIRSQVHFEERNLFDADPSFWAPNSFDVIFCRNVIIYFSSDSIRSIVSRFAKSLTAGGILFMGHSETLEKVSSDFERHYLHGAFCYGHKALAGGSPNWSSHPPLEGLDLLGEQLAVAPTPWHKRIEDAAHRVQRLVDQRNNPITSETPEVEGIAPKSGATSANGFDEALRLFHEEHFDEALAALRRSTSDTEISLQSKLLLGLISCRRGQVEEAKTVCLDILAADPTNSGAHHVLALCCKHVGDAAGAADHDYDAVLADPGFAIAHLHLGILMRRAGNWGAASSALSRALALLPHESDEKILLFGEGFSREALMFLCRAEIHHLGRST